MSASKLAETHNLAAFLKKPTESEGFKQIVDFLNVNPVKYALIVNPTIYTLCIQQFWDFAKVKTINEDVQIRALVDGKKIIITKDLLDVIFNYKMLKVQHVYPMLLSLKNWQEWGPEEEGEIPTNTQDTPNLTQPSSSQPHRKHKSRRKQRKATEFPHTEPQIKEHIPTPSHDPLPSGEDRMQLSELMEICLKLFDMVLSLEQIKTNQAAKIEKLKKRVKKLEGKKKRTNRLKRLYKVGLNARVESSKEKEDQEMMNDEDLFGVNDLDGDEVIVDVTTGGNVEQDAITAEKEVSAATDEVVTTTDEVVTTAESVKGITAAITLQISKDDVTLAQTLIEIKAAKPRARGVIVPEPGKFRTTSSSQPSQLLQAKDKGKGIMVELKKPLKKKDQIAFEEEVTRKLDAQMKAEMEEKERIAREKDEANRAYFAAKRAEEIKNKPPTKAEQKSLMCTYMKNMEGYKKKDFKEKRFDAIKKMFDKVYKRVNTFVAMDSEVMEGSKKTQAEVTEGSSKRARDEIEQESAKRQKLEKEDDTAELKRCLVIVLEDDDITIKATPLSSKSPTIVDYKIYKEGKKSYFKIIRADGNSQNYLTFRTMFKNFN
nr:hypothetical protein [Tanacetum cinerariifolium]